MRARARFKAMQGLLAGTLALLSSVSGPSAALAASLDDTSGDADDGDHADASASTLPPLARNPSSAARASGTETEGAPLRARDGASPGEPSRGTGRVRCAAARGLARWLELASGPERAAVESDWATAESAATREALALALGLATPDWLTDLALAELAEDREPRVRRAALESARALLASSPAAYVRVAAARLADPDRRVRDSARRLLRQAEPRGWAAPLRPSASALRASRKRYRRALRADEALGRARRAAAGRRGRRLA